jgi:hypothetical protein
MEEQINVKTKNKTEFTGFTAEMTKKLENTVIVENK